MLLKVGSICSDVKKVQTRLGMKADGIFGTGTENAVKAWQGANGLIADGIVGMDTFLKMFPDAATGEPAGTGGTDNIKVSGLSLDKLINHVPDAVINEISGCAEKFQINSALRLAHFLAQCSHESGGFKVTQENLNYSAAGLKKIFSKYFPDNLADSYARQPEKIASRVYANRMGNGDEASKDGFKFRGRGYIQLTGKKNYRAFDETVEDNILNESDLVAFKYPLLSAAWFWQSRSLNTMADKGSGEEVVTEITKKVNGGTIGLAERIKYFKEFYELLA
jgi:putative chitinase